MVPDSTHRKSSASFAKMEDDRTATNIGQAVDTELSTQSQSKPKQPRKRFIGRKEAAERADHSENKNRTIEDSGAIQGAKIAQNL